MHMSNLDMRMMVLKFYRFVIWMLEKCMKPIVVHTSLSLFKCLDEKMYSTLVEIIVELLP